MKQIVTLMACATVLTFGAGCAGLTKGLQTFKGTVTGAFDTVEAAVGQVLDAGIKGAEAADKIVSSATDGADEVVGTVTSTNPAP
jgi:hypothetical protein